MFQVGSEYTREQIHAHCGGSKQSYLPTVKGQVVAACLTPKLNPRAPNVILCGRGPVIAAAGAALASQVGSIPVFVKLGVNRWAYRGQFGVKASYSSGSKFSELVSGSGREARDVSLAIVLA
jgi:hypothetical protein